MGQTYKLAGRRPKPWSWGAYERWLKASWAELLDTSPTELLVQQFLEQHPCLLPGGEGGVESIGGHHGAFPAAVFSQAELPGLTRPVPDFMWITKLSGFIRPVLIEIERPSKKWFRKDGVLTGETTQAIDQLGTWRDWFNDEAHRTLFYRRYGISEWVREYHKFDPVYCLVFGRRKEFENDPHLSRKRSELQPAGMQWMTFDRLRPLYDARHAVTVRRSKGGFRVLAIPPTFEFGPEIILGLRGLTGLDQAIAKNKLISPDRRLFLIGRLSYWNEWAEQANHGSYSIGDSE